MPIYEYACKKCDSKFEKLIRMSSEEKIVCPDCGSNQTHRALSVFAVKSESQPSPSAGMCGCGKRAGSCGAG